MNMNKEELVGSIYGEWTILSYNEKVSKEKHRTYYNCKCSCGTIKPVCYNNLRNKKSTNCGCKKKEEADKYGLINEIGNKYGRLTVFERSDNNRDGDKRAYWNCVCDCGNIVYGVCGSELRNKSVQSCGCLHKEVSSENIGRMNLCNWQDKEYREEQTKRTSEQMKQQWENEEYKNNMSNKLRERWQDKEYKEAHSGENHCNYNPNLTDEERKLMEERRQGNSEYRLWAYKVKERDDFTCNCCGDNKGGNLVSHHLNAWNKFKEQRYDIENGVCLCEQCHKEFHKKYGRGNNTKQQYIEFKNDTLAKKGVDMNE